VADHKLVASPFGLTLMKRWIVGRQVELLVPMQSLNPLVAAVGMLMPVAVVLMARTYLEMTSPIQLVNTFGARR
jgi:hypothetical protein